MDVDTLIDSEYKKKAIAEVLHFIQVDLDQLPEEEKPKIAYIVNKILLAPVNKRGMDNSYIRTEEAKDWHESGFNQLGLANAKSIQKTLKRLFFDAMRRTESPDVGVQLRLPKSDWYLFRMGSALFVEPMPSGPRSLEKRAVLNFAFLLDGIVPIKCEQCGRYFPNLTRKRKIYCSATCTWRALSRKRREELKKSPKRYRMYLKKQREIMKRTREEKRKEAEGRV